MAIMPSPLLGATLPLVALQTSPQGPLLRLTAWTELPGALRLWLLDPQGIARAEPGALCAEPIVLKRQRLIFWLVALALLALLSVPWLAPFFL